MSTDSTCTDSIPSAGAIDPKNLLILLCESTKSPSFSVAAKNERVLRKNTMESLDMERLDIG